MRTRCNYKIPRVWVEHIMNKKVIIAIVGVLCLITSCATTYKLDKTVWYNTSLVEKDGVNAMITTSLYFISPDTIDVYSSVMIDTNLVVTPFKIAKGTYSISGNPKKEGKITINTENLNTEVIEYNGVYHKDKAMILMTQDSIAKLYRKMPNITLP